MFFFLYIVVVVTGATMLEKPFKECGLYKAKALTVYLFLDGLCRPIPNPTTYFNLYNSWSLVNTVDDDHMSECPIGSVLKDGALLIKHAGSNAHFFMNENKREIAEGHTFETCNFDQNKAVTLPDIIIDFIPTGPIIDLIFKECELYKAAKSDAVYLFLDGLCRHIPNPATYFNLYESYGLRNIIDDDQMSDCSFGSALQNGAMLIKAAGSDARFFLNENKREIANEDVFETCNFDQDKVVTVPDIIFDTIPRGLYIDL